jgi:hypothetical protein
MKSPVPGSIRAAHVWVAHAPEPIQKPPLGVLTPIVKRSSVPSILN